MRGDAIVIGGIKPFNGIAQEELVSALAAIDGGPLSGYLAGKSRGGRWVRALEDRWCETFHVKHAVACNSATSGLLAASFAVGLRRGDQFACSAMTMSATAAAPMFTGAAPFRLFRRRQSPRLLFLAGAFQRGLAFLLQLLAQLAGRFRRFCPPPFLL